MQCYLREYLALKRCPVLGPEGESGVLRGISFSEPDWRVASIAFELGTQISLAPEQVEYSMEGALRVRLPDEGAMRRAGPGSGSAKEKSVDADALLGYSIVSRDGDDVGGRIEDLLINVKEWCLRYLVADNGKHLVLLDASWLTGLAPDSPSAIIDGLAPRALWCAPQYHGLSTLTPGYEEMIYRHYSSRDFVPEAKAQSVSGLRSLS